MQPKMCACDFWKNSLNRPCLYTHKNEQILWWDRYDKLWKDILELPHTLMQNWGHTYIHTFSLLVYGRYCILLM